MDAWKSQLLPAAKFGLKVVIPLLFLLSPSASGQVQVAVLPGEVGGLDGVDARRFAPSLLPLPSPAIPVAPSLRDKGPSPMVETQRIKLTALPTVSAVEDVRTAVTVQFATGPFGPKSESNVVQASSSQDAPTEASVNPPAPIPEKPKTPTATADDVRKPIDPFKVFQNLQIKSEYFESATVSEITRLQTWAEGPCTWSAQGYSWQSPTFCFSPLYFEQPNLERYGQGVGRPFASTTSAIVFVADVTTLPIALVCTPPWATSCTLGHHRPGDIAPYQRKTLDH